MSDKIFVDTNILIYAHDIDSGSKHDAAVKIITDLWEKANGILSNQVLQEFYIVITRKIPKPTSLSEARSIIRNYLKWQIEENNSNSILRASEIQEKYNISFWDALIIAAAQQAGATKIITEDMNSGQTIESILIENPFSNV